MRGKHLLAQPPGVGIADVVDPALHAGIQLGGRAPIGLIRVQVTFQPAGELHCVAPLEQAVRRVHHKAQPGDAAPARYRFFTTSQLMNMLCAAARRHRLMGRWRLVAGVFADQGVDP